jgi:ribosomal protein S4E
MIKKVKEGYRVVSEKSGRNTGTYKTKDEAKVRLRQVEFFKHKNAKTKGKK